MVITLGGREELNDWGTWWSKVPFIDLNHSYKSVCLNHSLCYTFVLWGLLNFCKEVLKNKVTSNTFPRANWLSCRDGYYMRKQSCWHQPSTILTEPECWWQGSLNTLMMAEVSSASRWLLRAVKHQLPQLAFPKAAAYIKKPKNITHMSPGSPDQKASDLCILLWLGNLILGLLA